MKRLINLKIKHSLFILIIIVFVLLPILSKGNSAFSCQDFLAKVKEGEKLLKGNFRITSDHVSCIIDNMAHLDNKSKRGALNLLGYGEDKRITPLLCKFLKDKNLSGTAQLSLMQQGDPRAIKPLIQCMREGYELVNLWWVLPEIDDPSIEKSLVEVLPHISGKLKEQTINFLAERGNQGIYQYLVDHLKSSDRRMLDNTIRKLAMLKNDRSIEPLIKKFPQADPIIKGDILETLAQFKKSQRVYNFLMQELKKEDDHVRSSAIRALQKVGNSQAVMPLFDTLFKIKIEKCNQSLGAIESALEAFMTKDHISLIPAIAERFPEMALRISRALKDPGAIPYLFPLLKHDDTDTRLLAYMVLAELGDTRHLPDLIENFSTFSEGEQSTVLSILWNMNDQRIIPKLVSLIKQDEGLAEKTAFRLLARWQPHKTLELILSKDLLDKSDFLDLIRKMYHEHGPFPWKLLRSLENPKKVLADFDSHEIFHYFDGPEKIPWLIKALTDKNDLIQEYAIWILGYTRSKKAVQPLLEKLIKDVLQQNPFPSDISDSLRIALSEIHKDKHPADFLKLLNQEDPQKRLLGLVLLRETNHRQYLPLFSKMNKDPVKYIRREAELAKEHIENLTVPDDWKTSTITAKSAPAVKIGRSIKKTKGINSFPRIITSSEKSIQCWELDDNKDKYNPTRALPVALIRSDARYIPGKQFIATAGKNIFAVMGRRICRLDTDLKIEKSKRVGKIGAIATDNKYLYVSANEQFRIYDMDLKFLGHTFMHDALENAHHILIHYPLALVLEVEDNLATPSYLLKMNIQDPFNPEILFNSAILGLDSRLLFQWIDPPSDQWMVMHRTRSSPTSDFPFAYEILTYSIDKPYMIPGSGVMGGGEMVNLTGQLLGITSRPPLWGVTGHKGLINEFNSYQLSRINTTFNRITSESSMSLQIPERVGALNETYMWGPVSNENAIIRHHNQRLFILVGQHLRVVDVSGKGKIVIAQKFKDKISDFVLVN